MAITSPGCLLPHQPLLTISLPGAKPETRWEVDRRKPPNFCPSISGATLFSAACAGSNSTVHAATTGEGSLGYRNSRAFPKPQGSSGLIAEVPYECRRHPPSRTRFHGQQTTAIRPPRRHRIGRQCASATVIQYQHGCCCPASTAFVDRWARSRIGEPMIPACSSDAREMESELSNYVSTNCCMVQAAHCAHAQVRARGKNPTKFSSDSRFATMWPHQLLK